MHSVLQTNAELITCGPSEAVIKVIRYLYCSSFNKRRHQGQYIINHYFIYYEAQGVRKNSHRPLERIISNNTAHD